MEKPESAFVDELRPRTRGLSAAVVVGGALGAIGVVVSALLLGSTDEVSYAPLVGAVAVAVWAAGGVGGTAAVATGWALAALLLIPPRWSLAMESRAELVRFTSALAIGLVVAGVGFVMRRGHDRAADAAERAEHSRLRMERLQGLAASLSAALTPQEVAGVMVNGVPEAIGAHGGALALLEGDELVVVDPEGARGQTLRPGSRMPLSLRAPIATAAREGTTAWVQRRREFVAQFPDGAALAPYASGALAVPVFSGDRLVGAMGFPFVEPDAVTSEIRAVARIAADLGGQALERAELYAQERTSREALDRILAVAPRFHQGRTTESVVSSICVEARRAFGCDVSQIWTPLDEDQLEVTWRDPPSPVLPVGTRIGFESFPGLIDDMRALRSMFVPNAQEHARGEALRHARELAIFSSLRIPIVIGAEFERILTLQWERVIPEPAPSVIALARRFADQAGLAIEQAERRRAQEETRSLRAVTEALAAAITPSEVGAAIVRQGVAALGARAATVYALADDGESVQLVAAEGYAPEVLAAFQTIALEESAPVTDVIRAREPIVCASPEEIEARYPWFDQTEDSFLAAPLIAGGRAIGSVFIGSFPEPERTLADVSVIIGVARQAAQALDRARLFEREQASADRLSKLQAVTAALSTAVTSRDVSFACLTHAVAGTGSNGGLVVLRRPSTSAQTVVAAIGVDVLEDEVPPAAAGAVAACLRTGRAATLDGWEAFPFANGALALGLGAGTKLASVDREWLLTLVSQGEQALDRAGRYETERRIAETLQRSVLPEHLPELHGVELAARYLPGTLGVDVGGDWYDAIQLEGGLLGVVVGDVVGKGVQAAAMMGQLRNALRAFAFEHGDPHQVVSRLGSLVDGMADAPFATLAYLVVDPRQRLVRYAVAGHPPPLVVAPDGTTTFLEQGRTLPIGVDSSVPFAAAEIEVAEGSTIVLYTDGLVERRDRTLDEGLRILAGSADGGAADPEQLVERLLGILIDDDERLDDVAILALRFAPAAIDDLEVTAPSSQDGLAETREALRRWLSRGAFADADDEAEIVLAVWEACANAVEHAQGPSRTTFDLRGSLDERGHVRIEVRDSGRWKPDDGGHDRGFGLQLMRSLMDTVDVTSSAAGTTVVMERQVSLVS